MPRASLFRYFTSLSRPCPYFPPFLGLLSGFESGGACDMGASLPYALPSLTRPRSLPIIWRCCWHIHVLPCLVCKWEGRGEGGNGGKQRKKMVRGKKVFGGGIDRPARHTASPPLAPLSLVFLLLGSYHLLSHSSRLSSLPPYLHSTLPSLSVPPSSYPMFLQPSCSPPYYLYLPLPS